MKCDFFENPSKMITEFPVYTCDGDLNGNLKISRLLQYNQTAGEYYCANYGLTHEKMLSDGYTIIMNRYRGEFLKPVTTRCKRLEFNTWMREVSGARIIRDTLICDEKGEELCRLSLESSCMDVENRKIIRPVAFKEELSKQKLSKPWQNERHRFLSEGFEFAGSRTARFSDIDYNGHINNTVYPDIAMDFFPFENYNKTGVKLFYINYLKEVTVGEKIDIYVKNLSKDTQTSAEIYGQTQSGKSFEFFAQLW